MNELALSLTKMTESKDIHWAPSLSDAGELTSLPEVYFSSLLWKAAGVTRFSELYLWVLMIMLLLRKDTVTGGKNPSPQNRLLFPSHKWQLSFPFNEHSELDCQCCCCKFLPNFSCKFDSIFSLSKSYSPQMEFYWHCKWMKNLSKDFGMWLRYYMSLHVCLFIFKHYYLHPLEAREKEKKKGGDVL